MAIAFDDRYATLSLSARNICDEARKSASRPNAQRTDGWVFAIGPAYSQATKASRGEAEEYLKSLGYEVKHQYWRGKGFYRFRGLFLKTIEKVGAA